MHFLWRLLWYRGWLYPFSQRENRQIALLRRWYAKGEQYDYFDSAEVIGWIHAWGLGKMSR